MADDRPEIARGSNPSAVAADLISTYNFAADLKLSSPDWSPSTINSNEPPVGVQASACAVGLQPSGCERQPTRHPTSIGRYQIEGILGEGGFGCVYLALDETLRRRVAVKVPHLRHVSTPEDAAPYLAEARTLASLDHAHIVPVYDVGSTPEFPCYMVSKYIEGPSLARLAGKRPTPPDQAAAIVAVVAEALHYAHTKGLVHRDVKPGNILIDRAGIPYLADFGLALREADLGTGSGYAGTPAYMSPEQARGEGNLVDGRSDIYSLGAVLYELLTGRLPFVADSRPQLMQLIANQEVKPPRQIKDTIPPELERICLKALAKDRALRYTTAKDFAADLRAIAIPPPPLLADAAEKRSGRELRTAFKVPGLTCSVALTLCVGFLALTIGIQRYDVSPDGHGYQVNAPAFPAPGAAPGGTEELQVLDFSIDYIRSENDGDRRVGQLGRDIFEARQGDAVTLSVSFSQPAYAYLLALRADGQIELCWPEDEDAAPPQSIAAIYPSLDPTHLYGLDEGVGQWAFLAIASTDPLPPFRQWRTDQGLPPWQPNAGTSGTVWEFTPDEARDASHLGTTRGKGRIARGTEPLVEVARWFKAHPYIEVIEGRGFVATPRN